MYKDQQGESAKGQYGKMLCLVVCLEFRLGRSTSPLAHPGPRGSLAAMSHPTVAAFAAACLIPQEGHNPHTLTLNAPYRQWCAVNGLDPIGYPPFAKALDDEVPTGTRSGRKAVLGYALRPNWKFAKAS